MNRNYTTTAKYTDIISVTNPNSTQKSTGTYDSRWGYTPDLGEGKGGPYNWTNPKRYDSRRGEVLFAEPDVWIEPNGTGSNGKPSTATYTRYHIWDGPNLSGYEPVPGWRNDLVDESVTEALNALRNNKMQLGSDAGEAHKTIQMIAGVASQLGKGILAAKHGRWGEIPNALGMSKKNVLDGQFPANRWLEYQYGWKPLMASMYDGQKALKTGLRKEHVFFKARAVGVDHDTKTVIISDDFHPTYEINFKAATVFYYKIANHVIDSLDQLGLVNPLSIAWELSPFSFVIDWFVPVGNVLSALTATAGLEFGSGFTSSKCAVRHNCDRANEVINGYVPIRKARYAVFCEYFYRDVYSSFPVPRVYPKHHPFSTARVANAIALATQLLR